MSRLHATTLNTAGRVSFAVGRALHDLGLRLCGLAGDLDARADEAGYWDHRPAPPFDSGTTRK